MKTFADNRKQAGAETPGRFLEVDSFYHLAAKPFSEKVACDGTACFVARNSLAKGAGASAGQQPPVYCLGKCYTAPATTGETLRPRIAVHAREAVVLERLVSGGARTLNTYRDGRGYAALQAALRRPREDIIRSLEASELRGRGGAGFPTGRKWRAAFQQPTGERFVIANGDEGDAGAYIDRFLMEDDPHAVIEGLIIAGYAVGARRGWIYLRREYPDAKAVLDAAVQEARSQNLLGERLLGSEFSFDIEVLVGQGSYVCGEETALMSSIEGRRPEVRTRPPFPTEHGLWGRPTVVNNVETLVNVPWILLHGEDAYRKMGFSRSRGTKVVSLNSLFNKPGLYEVEFGVPVQRIVEDFGGGLHGGRLKGLIIGGPLAGIIPPHLLDTPFGFEELRAIGGSVGHGGVIAFDEHTSIARLMQHVFSFGAFESCGKCTPCRLGSRRIEQLFTAMVETGAAPPSDEQRCRKIVEALKLTSLCGLGAGLAEFAESVFRHYGKELESCWR